MAEFLLELFSEEIPARMQARGAEDLRRLVTDGLAAARLQWSHAEAHVTPRRLVVVVDGLPVSQPDITEERRGPRVDASTQAIEGFLRSTGLTLEQCEKRQTPKGDVWFAVIHRKGRRTEDVLVDIVRTATADLPWPKTMRWAEGGFRWVRPLHHILAVFDRKPITGDVAPEAHHRWVFSAITRGHRFLAPGAFPVTIFGEYRAKLRDAYVMLDREERKGTILRAAHGLAAAEGLQLKQDPGLLEEVAGLVEWPVVLMGRIDDRFMGLPPEVLTTAMRAHQRYFSVTRQDGALAPRFIVVANTVTRDGGTSVVEGNERVLRARLADAQYFWDHDRRIRLEDRVPRLRDIVFHARLGSMEDKVIRLQTLAADLAEMIPGAPLDKVRSAALLAKADLVTDMVGEFPELQGVMGRYYALEEGEDPVVAEAVAEHYSPLGPADHCPRAPVAVTVALADKADSLAGFFAIGERPTGSRDPYALRRAALGVIRLIVENRLRLPLSRVFAQALGLYRDQLDDLDEAAGTRLVDELLDFFADRLKVALREQGVRHDLIDAVFAIGGEDDLVRLLARVDALRDFLATEDGANLLTAYRRAGNIVRIESRKDKRSYDGAVDSALFCLDEEKRLDSTLGAVRDEGRRHLGAENFAGAMAALAGLRGPVDSFFDAVTVNAEDPALRANRLALLSQISATMNQVADFSKIEG
jgi:glycyl-tRNA synthetase beta chain